MGRVLFLHSSAGLYGADLQLVALAGGLRRRGWETVAVLAERGDLEPRLEAEGVEVVVEPLAVLRRRLLSASGLRDLAAAARSERPRLKALASGASLVHSNTSVILGGGAAASANGIPHVMHVREIYEGATRAVSAPGRPSTSRADGAGETGAARGRLAGAAALAWPLWRRRLEQADALACVSGAVASQFRRSATVIHDGLPDTDRWKKAPMGDSSQQSAFSVGILGRLADWKGQDVLVRAIAEPALAEIGAVAVIAGDAYPGETAPDIAGLARELGVAERVQMLGFRSDPEAVLASVDAVAIPSTRPDPFPNSALEALAAGRPVVAADHGGLPEMVRDGKTGVLVPPRDHVALARALRRLADDPAGRARMGGAAAADVRERFGMNRMLDGVEGLYARLSVSR